MGNDPRCMVSWDAEVKMAFFIPVIILATLSVVLMIIVHCNIRAPALRKASFIEDQVIRHYESITAFEYFNIALILCHIFNFKGVYC